MGEILTQEACQVSFLAPSIENILHSPLSILHLFRLLFHFVHIGTIFKEACSHYTKKRLGGEMDPTIQKD